MHAGHAAAAEPGSLVGSSEVLTPRRPLRTQTQPESLWVGLQGQAPRRTYARVDLSKDRRPSRPMPRRPPGKTGRAMAVLMACPVWCSGVGWRSAAAAGSPETGSTFRHPRLPPEPNIHRSFKDRVASLFKTGTDVSPSASATRSLGWNSRSRRGRRRWRWRPGPALFKARPA